MGQRYAVLISGDLAENGYPEFFFDVVLMRDMLINNGFQANNIFVLYGDGADYNNPFYPAARYRPNPPITDLSATSTNVQAIFSDLANGINGRPQLNDDDLLFVWTFDHGNQVPDSPGSATKISRLGLRDGDMRADDFATAIDVVPHAFRIICMQQCRSGGFIPHLASDRTVIITASEANRNAHPSDDADERETIGGRVYPHGEFNFYLHAALNGSDLLGNAVAADADSDGFTTMEEVFDFIINNESDSATPQYDDGSRSLGERLHLTFADLFMRDNLNDNGIEPSPGGGLSLSPDINHFRNELLDPQATLLGSNAMADGTLFEIIEIGQPNYIYVRVQNRGYSTSDATVDLYWTRPSTLPNPASWNRLGSIDVPSVASDGVACGGPLVWSDGVPARGHYCFVGLLRNAQDPAPDPTAIADIGAFYDLIRSNNNVVWKNFDVDNLFAGGYARIEFHIQGWPRKALWGDLEIDLSPLPSGISAELRILKRLLKGVRLDGMRQASTNRLHTRLKVRGSTRSAIRGMRLRPSEQTQGVLYLTLPEDIQNGAYDISIRQLVGRKEMGRITRRLTVGEHAYTANRNSLEIHRSNCEWVQRMAGKHKIAYSEVGLAVKHGYNGCYYCLPEHNTG